MNRFERPQINNQSKQALSIMLRQRHPPFMPGNQPTNSGQFTMQQQRTQQLQQQQHQQSQQQQQQHQQQQYINRTNTSLNTSLRGMNPSVAAMGNNQMSGMVQPMGPGLNPNNMMANQPGPMPQSQIAQNQQPGIGIMGPSSGGSMMSQTGRITPASMGQGGGMIGQAGGNMIPQGNRTMPPSAMMSQQGIVPQQGIQQGVQGQSMFTGTPQQFGGMAGMAQNFGGGYGNQGIPQQPNLQQNIQMGNFSQQQINQRTQAEFLAQQQRNLQQQQQQQANQQQVQANRQQQFGQQQVPNVTMQGQGIGQGGAAPPYPRQQPTGGKVKLKLI